MQRTLWTVLAGLCLASPIAAQTPPRVLVNQPINEAQRTMLHGNVSPLAQPHKSQINTSCCVRKATSARATIVAIHVA